MPEPTAGPPAVTSVRMIRNTLVNGGALLSGMLVTLFLTPLMLHKLGAGGFGIWALALTLTFGAGYLSLTDLGLQQAAVRFLANARAEGDTDGMHAVFSATLAIFVVLSFAAAAIVAALSPVFADIFRVTGPVRHAAVVTFIVIATQVIFDLPALAYRAVLESHQRFVALRLIDVGRSLVFAGLVVTVLLLGRGVVAVAASSLSAAAGAFVACAAIVHLTEPDVRVRRNSVTGTQLRRLLTFSSSLFALRILSVIYRQMDKLIIGIVLAVTAVAQFEIASRLGAALILAVGIMGSALLPAAALSHSDPERLRELFLRVTAYSVAVFVPLAVSALVFARLLLTAWVGTPAARDATSSARLFFLWVAIGTFDAAGTTMLISVGRVRPIVWCTFFWVLANLALSIWLVHVWGVAGVVAGTVFSYVPLVIVYTFLCLRTFAIPFRAWLRRVLLPNLPGPGVQIALALALRPYLARLGPLPGALLGILGTSALALAIYAAVGIERTERRALLGSLRAALSRSG